jgi:hypothetical protein
MNDRLYTPRVTISAEEQLVQVFICYAHKDVAYVNVLREYLRPLAQQERLIRVWSDKDIRIGDIWREQVDAALASARIVLPLVSVYFINSEHCSREMGMVLKERDDKHTVIVPIVIRHYGLKNTPYEQFQALPKDLTPINRPKDYKAWREVQEQIRVRAAAMRTSASRAEVERKSAQEGHVSAPRASVAFGARPSTPDGPRVRDIVGFDLGHGETSVARASPSGGEPQILRIHGHQSQITAVGYDDSHVVIGRRAMLLPNIRARQTAFKLRPPGTEASRAALADFARGVREYLIKTHGVAEDAGTHYFVGRPSGWSGAEAEAYRQLLATALGRVTVVPESRAALIQAKENGKLTPEQLRSTILVMDMGSSTIDVTSIFGGVKDDRVDFGTELGSHLLEKEILRRAIARNPRAEEIRALFSTAEGEELRTICEATCREAKEEYWNLEGATVRKFVPIGNTDLLLDIFLDDTEMARVLAAPLPELGGRAWQASFITFLDNIKEQLEHRRVTPTVLVLTGGASLMTFTQALCRERFSVVETVTPADETVALGLARWGSIQLRTIAFSEEVLALCREIVPGIVEKHGDDLRDRIARELAKAIVADVVAPATHEWRAGRIRTLVAMKENINDRMTEWLRSDRGVTTLARACAPVMECISAEVDPYTFEICDRHAVPRAGMRLSLDRPIEERLDLVMSAPFDSVFAITAGISVIALVVLTGVAKVALVTAGPPGWLVAALLSAWASVFGTMALREKLESADLPDGLRNLVSAEKLSELADDAEEKLRDNLKAAIAREDMAKIRAVVVDQVSGFLNARAEEVKWIIA